MEWIGGAAGTMSARDGPQPRVDVVPSLQQSEHRCRLRNRFGATAFESRRGAMVRSRRIADVDLQVQALEMSELRALSAMAQGGQPGPEVSTLKVRGSDTVKEGQEVLFTGYPIGPVLGLYPATHRGMVSSISPIAIPQARAGELDPHTIRRLSSGVFPIYQLDATAYPGNSGSPIYDPENGEVLGVINMVFVKGTKESALTQPSGITYAVPSSHIEELLKKSR